MVAETDDAKRLQALRNEISINKAKIAIIRFYGERFEESLHTLGVSLLEQGYTKDEVREALHATLPTFKAGIDQLLTQVDGTMRKALADA